MFDKLELHSSELPMLWMMGWHRDLLSRIILDEAHEDGGVDWPDRVFDPNSSDFDSGIRGISNLRGYIACYPRLAVEYRHYFPAPIIDPIWGGICRTNSGRIVFLESFSYGKNLNSRSSSTNEYELTCKKNLKDYAKSVNLEMTATWTECYWTFAKKLLTLYFLEQHNIRVSLISLYFVGHGEPDYQCASGVERYSEGLLARDLCLGLKGNAFVSEHVRSCFLTWDGQVVRQV